MVVTSSPSLSLYRKLVFPEWDTSTTLHRYAKRYARESLLTCGVQADNENASSNVAVEEAEFRHEKTHCVLVLCFLCFNVDV